MKGIACLVMCAVMACMGVVFVDAGPVMAQQCNVQNSASASASSAAQLQALQNQLLAAQIAQPTAVAAVASPNVGLNAVQAQQLLSLLAAAQQPRLAVSAPVVAAPIVQAPFASASSAASTSSVAAVPAPQATLLSLLAAPVAPVAQVTAVSACGPGGCAVRAPLRTRLLPQRSTSRSRSVSVTRQG
jgi:hypothetical protein